MDKSYVKIKSVRYYLYRAVDNHEDIVNLCISETNKKSNLFGI
ncbi:DDE-type integrase/transposase/recombinase [Candidatus Enterovibrio escicola]